MKLFVLKTSNAAADLELNNLNSKKFLIQLRLSFVPNCKFGCSGRSRFASRRGEWYCSEWSISHCAAFNLLPEAIFRMKFLGKYRSTSVVFPHTVSVVYLGVRSLAPSSLYSASGFFDSALFNVFVFVDIFLLVCCFHFHSCSLQNHLLLSFEFMMIFNYFLILIL